MEFNPHFPVLEFLALFYKYTFKQVQGIEGEREGGREGREGRREGREGPLGGEEEGGE